MSAKSKAPARGQEKNAEYQEKHRQSVKAIRCGDLWLLSEEDKAKLSELEAMETGKAAEKRAKAIHKLLTLAV